MNGSDDNITLDTTERLLKNDLINASLVSGDVDEDEDDDIDDDDMLVQVTLLSFFLSFFLFSSYFLIFT